MSDIESIDQSMSRLEEQRSVLGDELVDTAMTLLREKRSALVARAAGEQRKLVTVVFADLVDFTVLSQRLDSEDVRAIVGAYFAAWRARIEGNGGVVEKFIGDAVMAVWGLSAAHEDDPHRAIRAALEMGPALASLNADVQARHGVVLSMRVGIDTGEVVVSTVDDRSDTGFVVVGESVNRAARLQAVAPPGGVLISSDTHRHVRGWFAFEPVPALRLKGITTPVDGHLVVAERRGGFWLEETRGVEGVRTSTVGRDGELGRLQDCFEAVVGHRRPQVVTVLGETGVGKSRLLLELDHWLTERPEPVTTLRGRASSASSQSPNALLRDLMAGRLGIQASDPPAVVAEKWRLGMEDHLAAGPTGPLAGDLARWLGFDIGDGARPDAGDDAKALRDRALSGFLDFLRSLAGRGPVAVLLEDLHWADHGSLECIEAAGAGLVGSPLLVVATARPALLEHSPRWGEDHDVHDRVDLTALSDGDSRRLLSQLLQRVGVVPATVTEVVVSAAEGNPFYLEELVTFLLETGVITRDGERWAVHEERMAGVQVPPTLRGVLQARVDALSAAERLALQRASVVGRVFWDDAVACLQARGEFPAALSTGETLDRLQARQVVYERRASSFDSTREFLFKHALLRDVTYDSVLRVRRQEYHERAAQWLEQLTARSGRDDEYAGMIAAHYDRAALPLPAASWYLRAGRLAAGIYAVEEAMRLLGRGIELTPSTEPGLRVDLLLERETVVHRMGDRAAQARDLAAAERALATTDDPVRCVQVLLARCRWLYHQSDYDSQAEVAERAVDVAGRAGLAGMEASARLWWGRALAWRNDSEAAGSMLRSAIDQARETAQVRLVGEALRALAIVAINDGDLAEAAALAEEACRVHRDDGDVEGETAALMQLGTVLYNQGRYLEARSCIEESLPILVASGYRYRQAIATGNLGSVAAALGELGPARRFAAEGVRLCRALDDKEGLLIALAVLGETHRRADSAAADAFLLEALELAREVGWASVASELELNLALAASGRGEHLAALRWAGDAVGSAGRAGAAQSEARARFALGRVLLGAARPGDAAGPLREALALAGQLGPPGGTTLVIEARAALAQALLRSEAPEAPEAPEGSEPAAEAVELAEAVLGDLRPDSLAGAICSGDAYLACWEVLAAARQTLAADALRAAGTYLGEAAARIDDDELYEGFRRVGANAVLAAALAEDDARGAGGDGPSVL